MSCKGPEGLCSVMSVQVREELLFNESQKALSSAGGIVALGFYFTYCKITFSIYILNGYDYSFWHKAVATAV